MRWGGNQACALIIALCAAWLVCGCAGEPTGDRPSCAISCEDEYPEISTNAEER